jgi:hypothetical protein
MFEVLLLVNRVLRRHKVARKWSGDIIRNQKEGMDASKNLKTSCKRMNERSATNDAQVNNRVKNKIRDS